ncbi:MAG: elongation factor P 5-aminopentanone reductase [Christensenellales bacterium]|jgi:3-oxoacyl-[acyl-carrier protein] reductase
MKTVLITGASRGIGAATAELMAKSGYRVVINYNQSRDKALELRDRLVDKGFDALAIKADVSSYDEVDNMFGQIESVYQGVDILVNNAGVSELKLLIDMSPDEFKRMIDVNLTGCFNTIKRAISYMLTKGGRIINISSVWGITGASMESHYSASKAGLIGLTKSLAKEYARSGITVNCIAPGVIDTEMNSHLTEQEKNALLEQIPAYRMGTPREVAETVLFLSKADYITGQIITIDGGLL